MCSLYGTFKLAFIRHKHPILADKGSVDSVLSGPAPGTWRFQDFIYPTAYIIIIDIQWGDCLDHNDKGNGDG